jgi:hypothetical protein
MDPAEAPLSGQLPFLCNRLLVSLWAADVAFRKSGNCSAPATEFLGAAFRGMTSVPQFVKK